MSEDRGPRVKGERPRWLKHINELKPCSYCGLIAGPCLGGKANCPRDATVMSNKLKAENTKFYELTKELEKKYPDKMKEAQEWVKEFFESQEELPIEFQQILADNIWELYLD